MKTHFQIYRDHSKKRDWRWRVVRAGRIVADGSEGYKRRPTLLKSLRALLKSVYDGKYEIVDG